MKAYITKITYSLPETVEINEINRLTKKTGIYRRHICNSREIASDLAIKAANKLFDKGIDKTKIDFIILCTQSPDYILPTTACILQDKLGLNKNSGAFDFNLGCSGFVYGLGIAKGLIESGQAGYILLITAETYSKYINSRDNAVKPLFGDGATACLIESRKEEESGILGNVFGTDGSGAGKLIVPVGAMQERFGVPEKETTDKYGNIRTNYNLYMDGAAISQFALEVVPKTMKTILKKMNLSKTEIDYFVFHQANKFILEFLQQKCELLNCHFWNDASEYGNTVSSSIPIALTDLVQKEPVEKLEKVMLIGFGVGLSWAGCIVNLKLLRN
ncbi:3-oxoacyl-ACP synthase III family protein [Pectinatus sottacetonis]|uniref:3-oxoacyl-ACP synthase III family protein n=1 Tax=Pectinatus sottacetonis TaxID=1002795 RepID=UPI0018C67ABF|nr:ketoacyl-ACP synthase III [Pectinatus sottacetonis]